MAEAVAAGITIEKAADSLFVVAKKKIGYMWNCKQNVENLKKEVKCLQVMKSQVQQQIGIAEVKGDNLIVGVEEWVEEAGQEISKAEVFLEQETNAKKTCFKIGVCGNWATLYHYGKGATEMMTTLKEQKEKGKDFVTCVSVETPPPTQLDVYQTKNPEDLFTHNLALNAIIAALEDETKQIIGIHGLGGVGKTTLAMEVAARVKKTNMLFADVVFTTISQTVNAEKIQKELEDARKRIMKRDKILIILDDVWEKLNLEELCIPCGSDYMNCKILLTSRRRDVCNKMNAQSIIYVDPLPTSEAWILFKRVVGEKVDIDAVLKPVALKVVEECGGLPLLIQAVGNALKDESIKSWERALTQLQKHAPSDIDEEIQKSFTHLKLSYDYLKSEEAKLCFLLCSLWEEDDQISLEDLVRYGVGLEKFDDLDSIEDARDRVQNAVNILISSGLLLKLGDEDWTKMHDVVRDVALIIASQGDNKFLVKAGQGLIEWLPRDTSLASYTGISLVCNDIIKLPDYKVNLPHLQIFLLHRNRHLSTISDELIGCMKNVKVLDISWNNISALPQSFQLLTKLRTLDLRGNKSLHEISILGRLRDLEILILNNTGITEIPKEIAQLVNLRVFAVKYCADLSHITPCVISALWRLEELCIDLSPMSEGVNGCIVEVMKLSKLIYLDLLVSSFDLIPEGFNPKNLKGFEIQIGDLVYPTYFRRLDRHIIISSRPLVNPLLEWLRNLTEVSRLHVLLYNIENLNNLIPTLYEEGFSKLERIDLDNCSNVSCLVDDDGTTRCDGDEGKTEEKFFQELKHLVFWRLKNLELLWKCPDEYISLNNLVKLQIAYCNKLERLFTVNVAQSLVSLKKLKVKGCNGLEEVIWGGDDESGYVIAFLSLATISLGDLPRLKRFFNSSGNCSIEYPSLVEVEIRCCKSMEIWGTGIHKTPNLKTLVVNDGNARIAVDGPYAINEAVEKAVDLRTNTRA